MMVEVHPLVIHFPIALLSSAILFDFFYIFSKQNDLAQIGWWVLLLGLISSSAGIGTGLWDDTLIGHLGSVSPIWINHGLIQIFSCALFLTLFIWRTKMPTVLIHTKLKWIYLGLGGFAIAILFYGGHLGAKLAGRI